MTDPVTNNYSFPLPTVGGDTNVWGGVLNNGVIQGADNALGGILAVAMSSTDVTLTAAQFQNAVFVVTGVLTANVQLIIPLSPNSATVACAGRFVVVNNTTGAFNVNVITAAVGSTGSQVQQGFAKFFYSDGTNVINAHSGTNGFARAVNGNPNGQLAGTAGSVNTNSQFSFDYTNGVLYICTTTGTSSTAVWSQPNFVLRRGFDTAVNLQINATVPANNLTLTLAAADTGLAPTAIDPITVLFRSATPATGAPVSVNVTRALSIATVAGASFGSVSNTPFRLWVVLFYNAGNPVLGLINCSTPSGIFPLNEARLASSVILNGASTAAGVFYTPGGTVSNSPFRILGFIEYETTVLVTPGTYTAVPDWVQLFGPGVKKPGDVLQRIQLSTASGTNNSSSVAVASAVTASITPTSKSNLVKVHGDGRGQAASSTTSGFSAFLARGSTQIGQSQVAAASAGVPLTFFGNFSFDYMDAPGVNVTQSYTVYFASANNGINANLESGVMILEEIMG